MELISRYLQTHQFQQAEVGIRQVSPIRITRQGNCSRRASS